MMDEEEGVSTPSTTSPSTPQSPPMHGTKVRPLDGSDRSSSREKMRPSVFQGDGLDVFIEMYGNGDSAGSTGTSEALFPPSPMERYEHWEEDVPWQLSGTMDGDVAGESREERKDERERRLSNVVEDALKVFSGTGETPAQSNSKSLAIIEAEVNHGKESSPTGETQESLYHDLMVPKRAERRKKMLAKGGVYAPVRQRKAVKKEDDALVEETGEVIGAEKGDKRKGKRISVVSDRGGYDISQRLRSFSISDDE